MSSPKILLFFAALLLVGAVAFITFTGPLSINGLAGLVNEQPDQATDGEYIDPAITIADTGTIERYRMRMTLSSVGTERWPDYITGEGAYVIEPRAEELTLIYEKGESSERVSMTTITDTYYLVDGDMAMQMPEPVIELHQLTLIDPNEATTLAYNFVKIEEEALNDRTTIHYQGDPKLLPADAAESLAMFGTATLDLWIDKDENFIVAMALRAYGVDDNPDASYEMRIDFYDFNNPDIVIAIPTGTIPVSQE